MDWNQNQFRNVLTAENSNVAIALSMSKTPVAESDFEKLVASLSDSL